MVSACYMRDTHPRLYNRNSAGNVFFLAKSPLAPNTTTVKHNFLGTLHCTLSRSEAVRSEGIGGPRTFKASLSSCFEVMTAAFCHYDHQCSVDRTVLHDKRLPITVKWSHVPYSRPYGDAPISASDNGSTINGLSCLYIPCICTGLTSHC